MPTSFTWFIQDQLGPVHSSHLAEAIGLSLAPNIVIGYHVVAPVDSEGLINRFIIFRGHYVWNMLLDSLMDRGDFWCPRDSSQSVLLYSRRYHDIIDERDEENALFIASWLASEGVRFLDWFVMTRQTVRSISADFDLPRGW
jgi:hypothetical protein